MEEWEPVCDDFNATLINLLWEGNVEVSNQNVRGNSSHQPYGKLWLLRFPMRNLLTSNGGARSDEERKKSSISAASLLPPMSQHAGPRKCNRFTPNLNGHRTVMWRCGNLDNCPNLLKRWFWTPTFSLDLPQRCLLKVSATQ